MSNLISKVVDHLLEGEDQSSSKFITPNELRDWLKKTKELAAEESGDLKFRVLFEFPKPKQVMFRWLHQDGSASHQIRTVKDPSRLARFLKSYRSVRMWAPAKGRFTWRDLKTLGIPPLMDEQVFPKKPQTPSLISTPQVPSKKAEVAPKPKPKKTKKNDVPW